jgi:hypothetical protein
MPGVPGVKVVDVADDVFDEPAVSETAEPTGAPLVQPEFGGQQRQNERPPALSRSPPAQAPRDFIPPCLPAYLE